MRRSERKLLYEFKLKVKEAPYRETVSVLSMRYFQGCAHPSPMSVLRIIKVV